MFKKFKTPRISLVVNLLIKFLFNMCSAECVLLNSTSIAKMAVHNFISDFSCLHFNCRKDELPLFICFLLLPGYSQSDDFLQIMWFMSLSNDQSSGIQRRTLTTFDAKVGVGLWKEKYNKNMIAVNTVQVMLNQSINVLALFLTLSPPSG